MEIFKCRFLLAIPRLHPLRKYIFKSLIAVIHCSYTGVQIRDVKEKWVLPSRRPNGTKNYKNRALRSPFIKSGSNSYISIVIDDPATQAIEFLVVDEAKNKWFKNNGQNFHIKLPIREKRLIPNVSVPEELVQIQAYLRWERKGKQMYTPEQEKASVKQLFNYRDKICTVKHKYFNFAFFPLFCFLFCQQGSTSVMVFFFSHAILLTPFDKTF
ncbi:PYRUVATE PHOSPHATE DIKINASE-RELATED [Salix koriyanagi]|uniref:PYRUVATE PHOSPHATE DIKINASE-RELATED n=1 Tax=Salix koriyanagi TaxID=2511006 RepID=A0A9Q0WLK1_9ROSI|nr:PYRUVATE PHOSPHATE DIKINASE-RELATED [Salix koriyanagi]KAJ6769309.1 PYRUVATE PHOSPHATE DIKINASE-RELATED [Salix koriyanagi]